jgi:hypothetical protein
MNEGTRFGTTVHSRKDVQDSDAYSPTIGRQGKRPAFGAAHVVGKTKEFAHVTNIPCWRFRQIVERFQPSDRRRSRFDQGTGSR